MNMLRSKIVYISLMLTLLTSLQVHSQNVTISNNLLYDAWLTPNLRVGVRLAPHWSVGLTGGYRPWPTSDYTTRKWKHLLVSPEARYWTDSVNVHHFIGMNLIYSHYNVGDVKFPFGMYKSVRDERRQGDLGALGAFYGYSWPIGRYFNIEALIGAAVGITKYSRYPCVHCGAKIGDETKWFVMPQAAINIVFNIPGRPAKKPVVEERPVLTPTLVKTERFIPVVSPVAEKPVRQDSALLVNMTQYRPYDRTQILRHDKEALYVLFPIDKSDLRPDYRGNGQTMSRILDVTRKVLNDTTCYVKTIQIVGFASVEGPVANNEKLAANRALALQRYVQKELNLPDSLFETVGGGEAWAELRDQLDEAAKTMPEQSVQMQKAIDIIDNESDLDKRERKLRKLDNGRVWQYVRKNALQMYRNSGYVRVYFETVPDENAQIINEASELLTTDCDDCFHEALGLLQKVRNDERAQNALGVALWLCGQKEEALQCLRLAAANGNADAAVNLRNLEKEIK